MSLTQNGTVKISLQVLALVSLVKNIATRFFTSHFSVKEITNIYCNKKYKRRGQLNFVQFLVMQKSTIKKVKDCIVEWHLFLDWSLNCHLNFQFDILHHLSLVLLDKIRNGLIIFLGNGNILNSVVKHLRMTDIDIIFKIKQVSIHNHISL